MRDGWGTRAISLLRGRLLCGQAFERRGLDELGVARFLEEEGVVAAALVDDAVAGAVELEDGFSGLSWSEPAVELDAELANGNFLVEKLVDDVVFESFDVHLEEIDGGVSVFSHDRGQVIAVEGDDIDAVLNDGVRAFSGILRYGELEGAGVRRETYGEELKVASVACRDGADAGWRWIEDEDGARHHLRKLEFEAHALADAGTVGDRRR